MLFEPCSNSNQALYTNFIIWVNIQSKHPQTNILSQPGMTAQEIFDHLTEAQKYDRRLGSICTFVAEETMCVLQWACKFSVLFTFLRLT